MTSFLPGRVCHAAVMPPRSLDRIDGRAHSRGGVAKSNAIARSVESVDSHPAVPSDPSSAQKRVHLRRRLLHGHVDVQGVRCHSKGGESLT